MLFRSPGNPRISLTFSILWRSSSVGALKYSCSYSRMIPLQNLRKHSNVVLPPILMYSSTASAATPYANIHIVVVHFANGDIPSLLVASTRYLKGLQRFEGKHVFASSTDDEALHRHM